MVNNDEISKILGKIGFLLEMGDENDPNATFKARSYNRASDAIASLSTNIEEIYKKEGLNGLLRVPSIGKAIAAKIEEYIGTGKIRYFEDLKSKTQVNLDEFYNLEGMGIGPKTIKALYNNLQIKNLSELENAAKEGRIQKVAGFSQKNKQF
jgi:DNA polymerase (family 10)